MRATHRCPKCQHGEVLHVPEPRDSDFDRLALGGSKNLWGSTANAGLEAYGAQLLSAESGEGPFR
jgi:hypothetical protein